MLVSEAYIDLGRHARALTGLAEWTTHEVGGSKLKNIGRVAKNEQRILSQVLNAARAHPDAFTDAPDVVRGTVLLERATATLDTVRELVDPRAVPRHGKVGDPSGATALLRSSAEDLRMAQELLGGTRELPAYEQGASAARFVDFTVAHQDDSAVRGRGHRSLQRAIHGLFDLGLGDITGIRTHGAENVPRSGSLLVAPNHGSMRDPIIHARALPRSTRFLASSIWWEDAKAPIGKAMQAAGAIPVKHGNSELGKAVERGVLATPIVKGVPRPDKAQAIVHYGEGLRNYMDAPSSHADGLAEIALQMHAPVLPMGTYGDNKARLFRGERGGRPMVEVVIGELIDTADIPATEANFGILKERIERAQEALTDRAEQLYSERRASSKARKPLWIGAGVLAATGGVQLTRQ